MLNATKILATDSPTNVTLSNDTISWTAPASPVSGYEVFYVTAAGETHSAGSTTDTNLTVRRLSEVCSVFVVAYVGDTTSEHTLPSARVCLNSKTVLYCYSNSFALTLY